MRVYIAAPWKHKADAKQVSERLKSAGFETVSRWVDFNETQATYEYAENIMATECMRDWEDLGKMEQMLYLNLAKSEGKATELGYALAKSIPVCVIGGKANNVFLHHINIKHLDSVEDFIVQHS